MLATNRQRVGTHSRICILASAILSAILISQPGSAHDLVEDLRGPEYFRFDPAQPSAHQDNLLSAGNASKNRADHERSQQKHVIHNGYVIWNGNYVVPPYTLSGEGDEVLLNGELVPQLDSPLRPVSFPGPRGGRAGLGNRRGMLRHVLESNGILIVGANTSLTIRPEFAGRFLEALLSDEESAAKMENLEYQMNGSGVPNNVAWASLVGTVVPTQDLRDRYTSMFSAPEVEFDGESNVNMAASITKRTVRYLMTVGGMILGVFGFGMLLQHQPHARTIRGTIDHRGTGFRLLPLYVLLVFMFSMFDLGCTLFANETGGLLELNPLGNRLLNSTLSMMLSKISVTALSATILFKLRQYRIAQIAAWWLCLVCVFLTLRWVTFTSMFLS